MLILIILFFPVPPGGTIVTLSGTGFSKDTTVTIGDATCVISDSVPNTYNTIVCVTSKGVS